MVTLFILFYVNFSTPLSLQTVHFRVLQQCNYFFQLEMKYTSCKLPKKKAFSAQTKISLNSFQQFFFSVSDFVIQKVPKPFQANV